MSQWLVDKLTREKKYAWAKYYQAENQEHHNNINTYHRLTPALTNLPPTTPQFVLDELKSLHIELRTKIECPICLDIIEPESMQITKCGHKYCKTCLDKLKETPEKKCALCRTRVAK